MGDDMDDEIARLEAELDSDAESGGSGSGGGGGGINLDDIGDGGDEDMAKLLANWESDKKGSDSDSDDDDDDDDDEEDRREVDLDDNTVDHVVLAASDMDKAVEEFEEKCGIKPKVIGSVKGIGVRQARISFEGSSFIEIIAPCPTHGGPIGTLLKDADIKGLVPFHYAVRNERCEDMKAEMKEIGYIPDHISMFGSKPDGTPRKWEMLYLYGHTVGGMCPFFINWTQADHPCETLPVVGKLVSVKVTVPEDEKLHKLIGDVKPKMVELSEGPMHFEFSFESPEGTIKFESNKMIGYRFPGFEDA